MEMEYAIATRRVRRILDHVWGNEDMSAPIPRLSIMNCNSSEGSVSQAGFVPQALVKENLHCKHSSATIRDSSYDNRKETLFSSKAGEKSSIANFRDVHSSKQDIASSPIEALKLAEQSCERIQDQPVYSRISQPAISDGLVWSPRIDVAECSSYYIVIVELPGVNINEIRVEVDGQNLTVTGKRLMQQQWRIMNSYRDSNLTYHRKEILQGPYEVNWALPKDIDRDQVSAEFVDGFLHVTIPKFCKG